MIGGRCLKNLVRRFGMFLAVLTLFGGSFASAQTIANNQNDLANMQRLPQNIGGNVRQSPEYVEYQWPAIYFEARFNGPKVIFKIDDSYNRFRVLIDGHEIGIIDRPIASQFEVTGLDASEHAIRIDKLTESISSSGRFYGFFVENQSQSLHAQTRERQIEFIGDSDLVGYGVLSKTRDCDGTELRNMTDSTRAYPSIIARHFDADFQLYAYSGIGMVRNYGNNLPGQPLTHFYGRTVFGNLLTTRREDFRPDIIYIALGSNDFSTEIKSGEPWQNSEELSRDFVQKYIIFLRDLRARNPNSTIFFGNYVNADSKLAAAYSQIIAQIASTDSRFHVILLPAAEATACHWHPSIYDHLSMAQIVISRINELKPNW
ncbi:MAG: ce2C [Hyphomonadaceae bacterium]|nr:MAG: ce2C [Hyphomonadaceae bacterium]KAF0184224.1 MAG: ce2C [Hyphomonadaceae bacterium]